MAEPHNPATAEADADAQAYVHGEMAINEQASTFDLFIFMTKWGSLGVAVLLVLLTLWFHPGGSFIAGLIGAVVLSVVGWFALKSKPKAR
ncbi:aa3-type cytochrome c oxidase subunit IV [Brevundimonas sp.]|uniref:aa3-type cytochrome c oxidase subunit IV n=1 Tax=Brevundimonas sp. TaxID=1871086 RepID=UPI0035B29B45